MKLFRRFIALCVICVLLAGCTGGSKETEAPAADTPAQSTEAGSTAQPATTAPADKESTSPDVTEGTSASVWVPTIEGYDAEHYPYIDGSTANHPLLARIYQEICGVDRETAENLVPFNLGSTGSIWWQMLYNPEIPYDNLPALYVVYEPPEDIKEEYEDRFEAYEIDPLGRDGLVFMVNVNNPVESLTVDELYGIYTGKITNWKEVGGNDEEIRPFQRNADSGSQTLFMKLLMHGEQPMDPLSELKVDTMGGLIDQVAAYDGSGSAIGFSVYYYANLMHANPSLKLISVNGVAPTNESIESAEYPLTNDFYVAIRTAEPADSPVRALRDFLLTDAGRRLLEEENYVWARQGLEPKTHGTTNPFK